MIETDLEFTVLLPDQENHISEFLGANKIEFERFSSVGVNDEDLWHFCVHPETTSELYAVAGFLHVLCPGGIPE
jgi:hypothetical protein